MDRQRRTVVAVVEVKASKIDGFRQEIQAGTHGFASDAPKEVGGSDTAPNPHELLLGSLGACTAITIQMYAKRKGWDLTAISVKVQEEQVENPERPGQKQSKISRQIELSGNLTGEQLDSLRAIADKCPIHKLLEGPKQIATEVSHKA
jgi:putative redox protein